MCLECMDYLFSTDEYHICAECQIATCDECNRRCDDCCMVFCGECFEGHSREEEEEEEEYEEEYEEEERREREEDDERPIDSPSTSNENNCKVVVPSCTDETDEEDMPER